MDDAGIESLLPGVGAAIAAAIVLLVAFALFRSTMPANEDVALEAVASEICGDIGTAAIATVPCKWNTSCATAGVNVTITGDYVVAAGPGGGVFARPVPASIYPGSYAGSDEVTRNGVDALRQIANDTCGKDGSRETPLDEGNASLVRAAMERMRGAFALSPLEIDPERPLIVEKAFVYTRNGSRTGSDPYVLVYQ